MRSICLRRFTAAALFALSLYAMAQDPPSAESILDRSNALMLGDLKLSDIQALKATGTVSMPLQGITGTFVILQKGQNRYLQEIHIPSINLTMSQGSDGTVAYENNPMTGVRALEGEEKANAMLQADWAQYFDWRQTYEKVRFLETVPCGEAQCHRLELTTFSGLTTVNSYDSVTGLLLKSEMTLSSIYGEIAMEINFDRYRNIQGMQYPTLLVTKALSQQMELSIEEVVLNPELSDDLFAPPAALTQQP